MLSTGFSTTKFLEDGRSLIDSLSSGFCKNSPGCYTKNIFNQAACCQNAKERLRLAEQELTLSRLIRTYCAVLEANLNLINDKNVSMCTECMKNYNINGSVLSNRISEMSSVDSNIHSDTLSNITGNLFTKSNDSVENSYLQLSRSYINNKLDKDYNSLSYNNEAIYSPSPEYLMAAEQFHTKPYYLGLPYDINLAQKNSIDDTSAHYINLNSSQWYCEPGTSCISTDISPSDSINKIRFKGINKKSNSYLENTKAKVFSSNQSTCSQTSVSSSPQSNEKSNPPNSYRFSLFQQKQSLEKQCTKVVRYIKNIYSELQELNIELPELSSILATACNNHRPIGKGKDCVIIISTSFLSDEAAMKFIAIYEEKKQNNFWQDLAKNVFSVDRIMRQNIIKDDGFRSPSLQPLWPILSDDDPRWWITHSEPWSLYCIHLKKTMFCIGNKRERERMSKISCQGETVLDLFVGIGYWSLVLAKTAKKVISIDWNPYSIEALKKGIKANKIPDHIITPILSDVRNIGTSEENTFVAQRIVLGLIPSSEISWQAAAKCLDKKKGGIVHIHMNVHRNEKRAREELQLTNTELERLSSVDFGTESRKVLLKIQAERIAHDFAALCPSLRLVNTSLVIVKTWSPAYLHVVIDVELRV